jgi:hypothetical protein
MLPTREPVCRALFDQVLARGVFRLNQPSRMILSRTVPGLAGSTAESRDTDAHFTDTALTRVGKQRVAKAMKR